MLKCKKYITIFAALFSITSTILINCANAQTANGKSDPSSNKLSFYTKTGYRVDNLNWSISGFNIGLINKKTGDTYSFPGSSKLSWSNIKIAQTQIGAYIPITTIESNQLIPGDIFLNTSLNYGKIFKGENQDSDYIGTNQLEFSRSNNSSKSGDTLDYSLSINYKIPLKNIHLSKNNIDNYAITPIAGYSIHKQNLTMTNGNQTINIFNPNNTGEFQGLNSTYNTNWQGPFLGLALSTNINQKHNLKLSGQYHITDYYAEANWNLRADFQHPKSFEHKAKGNGQTIKIEYNFKPKPENHLIYTISINYKKFTTGAGTDKTFFSDGSSSEVKLDKVTWDSKAVMVGVSYEF